MRTESTLFSHRARSVADLARCTLGSKTSTGGTAAAAIAPRLLCQYLAFERLVSGEWISREAMSPSLTLKLRGKNGKSAADERGGQEAQPKKRTDWDSRAACARPSA